MSTTVVPLASGAATSRTSFNPANPKPDRGLTLPSLSLTDDGNGPTVRSLLLQMPEADLGGVPVASSLGDQQLPAAIRAGALAGPALSSNVRGVTLRTTGSTPLNVSFGQIPVKASGVRPDSPAFAAATMSFSPISRLSRVCTGSPLRLIHSLPPPAVSVACESPGPSKSSKGNCDRVRRLRR